MSLLAMCDEFSVNSLEESRSLGEQRRIVGRLIEAAHEKDEEGKMKDSSEDLRERETQIVSLDCFSSDSPEISWDPEIGAAAHAPLQL